MLSILATEWIGFPYEGDSNAPAQKRLVILKTERKFQNLHVNGNSSVDVSNFSDSGFYIIR